MTNNSHKPLYVGMTNDLERRVFEHKNKINPDSYAAKYNLKKLIYWEQSQNIESVIIREKQIKHWKYDWKIDLVKTMNPLLLDLSLLPGYTCNSDILDAPSSEA